MPAAPALVHVVPPESMLRIVWLRVSATKIVPYAMAKETLRGPKNFAGLPSAEPALPAAPASVETAAVARTTCRSAQLSVSATKRLPQTS